MKIIAALAVTIFFLCGSLRLQQTQISVLTERHKGVANLNDQLVADLKQSTATVSDVYRQRNKLNLIVQQQNEKMLQLEVQRDDFYKQIRQAKQANKQFENWSTQRINDVAIRMLNCRTTTGRCGSD